MNIQPLENRILVKYAESEKTTESGFILTESAQKKPTYCTIIQLGPKVENKQLATGTKVMTVGYAGTDIEVDGVKYSIVKETDIIAIVKDES